MSLAHGIRIGALGIALLAVAGWGAGGVGAMPDGADARVTSTKAELPPFNFEIRTLSNRADLLSDGDALVDVRVPKTVPMKKVTLTLNGVDVGDRFVADEDALDAARRVDRPGARREHLCGGRQRQRQRTAVGEPHAHESRARWPHSARLADAALDLRHADAGGGLGQHAGVQRQRPVDLRAGRAVQHRHRVQAVLDRTTTPGRRPARTCRRSTASSQARTGRSPLSWTRSRAPRPPSPSPTSRAWGTGCGRCREASEAAAWVADERVFDRGRSPPLHHGPGLSRGADAAEGPGPWDPPYLNPGRRHAARPGPAVPPAADLEGSPQGDGSEAGGTAEESWPRSWRP